MLLTIDVGNTNITFGVFEGKEVRVTFRMMTPTRRTSDEYGLDIRGLVSYNGVDPNEIRHVIISSVVPAVMHSLSSAIVKYFKITPLVVGPGVKTGIRIVTGNPGQIGADRIVDAVGALEYGGPVIAIDYGTATTYDLIGANGDFLTGITAPGIRMSAKALWEDTAKLPEIEIVKPPSIMAKDTTESMQAGLIYGQIGQTEYIIRALKEASGLKDAKVIATGGLGRIISDETDEIQVYDPNLTLNGMRLIYERNKN
jgi:type III pantothenate kinase